jgi:hypothetical protein
MRIGCRSHLQEELSGVSCRMRPTLSLLNFHAFC